MHQTDHHTFNKKRHLRDQPSTSLRDTNTKSPLENPQRENSSDQRGPDIVKPGVGSQVPGQTSHQ
jgi:hypothetical protein